jgi:hypothetical protein
MKCTKYLKSKQTVLAINNNGLYLINNFVLLLWYLRFYFYSNMLEVTSMIFIQYLSFSYRLLDNVYYFNQN